jgi:uncharacterized protein YndB with AHSA1/START domain
MNIVITIVIILAGIIALLLIIALLSKKAYTIQREVIINAPTQKVFDFLKQIKNQDFFNKWVMADPAMKKQFIGTDGTVGFIYAWNGNKKVGEGEQEIKGIIEGQKIETELRFVRPFSGISYSYLATESTDGNQTKVKWGKESKMKYPMNIMISMIEKMLAKDMDTSLIQLKKVLEK